MSEHGEPERFELLRPRQGPIIFNGHLLGSSSTKRPGKRRWTEINVYQTIGRMYVLEILGCTDYGNESTIRTVSTHNTASELFEKLKGGRASLSAPAYDVLDAAATVDDELDRLLDQYETKAQYIS